MSDASHDITENTSVKFYLTVRFTSEFDKYVYFRDNLKATYVSKLEKMANANTDLNNDQPVIHYELAEDEEDTESDNDRWWEMYMNSRNEDIIEDMISRNILTSETLNKIGNYKTLNKAVINAAIRHNIDISTDTRMKIVSDYLEDDEVLEAMLLLSYPDQSPPHDIASLKLCAFEHAIAYHHCNYRWLKLAQSLNFDADDIIRYKPQLKKLISTGILQTALSYGFGVNTSFTKFLTHYGLYRESEASNKPYLDLKCVSFLDDADIEEIQQARKNQSGVLYF
jgi:hypothetical protein